MPEKRSSDDAEDQPSPKHPADMTSEEALDHLFHPEIARKLREHAQEEPDPDPEEEA